MALLALHRARGHSAFFEPSMLTLRHYPGYTRGTNTTGSWVGATGRHPERRGPLAACVC